MCIHIDKSDYCLDGWWEVPMDRLDRFYIDGDWVAPFGTETIAVVDPATECVVAEVAAGSAADADRAVAAARAAVAAFAAWSPLRRLQALQRLRQGLAARRDDLARAISMEMGAPLAFAQEAQVGSGLAHLDATIAALPEIEFEVRRGALRIRREPIGVAALITPWNWPLNQIVCKVAPAIAAGVAMVLKPSEVAPLSALLFAEIVAGIGLPAGAFNLVNGTGAAVGQALAAHPEVDMVSFTGSTRAGIAVAATAAASVKRVHQELGGKSPFLVLDDAPFAAAVERCARACFANSGQSCDAPTRLYVPRRRHDEALEIAARIAAETEPGLGPLAYGAQFAKVQELIEAGIGEGALLAAGGPGRPAGRSRGFYARPTVFGRVENRMTIAREEIFGPVLSVLAHDGPDDAVAKANDSPFGLAGYVHGGDLRVASEVADRVRAGIVYVNDAPWVPAAPFGGYKRSGNGREHAGYGIREYLETKAIVLPA